MQGRAGLPCPVSSSARYPQGERVRGILIVKIEIPQKPLKTTEVYSVFYADLESEFHFDIAYYICHQKKIRFSAKNIRKSYPSHNVTRIFHSGHVFESLDNIPFCSPLQGLSDGQSYNFGYFDSYNKISLGK